jgi:ASC-1-like (ASCH) protein
MTHELKCWPEYFDAIYIGEKKFEVRKNDRNYQVGDSLYLQEWSPQFQSYTGRMLVLQVTYILQGGQFGIEEGYVVMSIR